MRRLSTCALFSAIPPPEEPRAYPCCDQRRVWAEAGSHQRSGSTELICDSKDRAISAAVREAAERVHKKEGEKAVPRPEARNEEVRGRGVGPQDEPAAFSSEDVDMWTLPLVFT